jgi:tetratricopeptide (TPR) repeat protein
VTISVAGGFATVGVSSARPPDVEGRAGSVLAFDVHVLVDDQDLVLVVSGARGSALPAPATAMGIGCLQTLLGPLAKRRGALFVLPRGSQTLARAILPEAGARVPTTALPWTSVSVVERGWLLQAMQGAIAAAPEDRAVRAREAAAMLVEADDAMLSGDHGTARELCLATLERAPRHVEIVRRIVEMDAAAGGRAEAALAMLGETRGDESAHLGALAGELLSEIGDLDAAVASLERAGESEPSPALAGRALEMAARLVRDPLEASELLDRALARSPRSSEARWARVARRLEMGRMEEAIADVEHLEAASHGGRSRYDVWARAGRLWEKAGLSAHAGVIFERALRFLPDEPSAMSGLGASLVQQGQAARGAALMARAVEIADSRNEPTGAMRLGLARALADALDDLPTAVAQVGRIDAGAPEAPLARGLEGRWRARLGDVAGAMLAFARSRDLAHSTLTAGAGEIADLLVEAAQIQEERLGDRVGAQRHLAAALRLRPVDARLRRLYREMGERTIGRPRAAEERPDELAGFGPDEAGSATHRTVTEPPSLDLSMAPEPEQDEAAVARVEELTRRLQGNARDDEAADELIDLLQALGRGHELLALVLARLEDATPERRAVLRPKAHRALTEMAVRAEAEGRASEAVLYRDALTLLGP